MIAWNDVQGRRASAFCMFIYFTVFPSGGDDGSIEGNNAWNNAAGI